MSTHEELLDDLNKKLEETWDEYDEAPDGAKVSYFLGKIRGLEYAINLLHSEWRV